MADDMSKATEYMGEMRTAIADTKEDFPPTFVREQIVADATAKIQSDAVTAAVAATRYQIGEEGECVAAALLEVCGDDPRDDHWGKIPPA